MVDAVIINFKRPRNVEKIIEALLAQTVKCRIIIYDYFKSTENRLNPEILEKVDIVFSSNVNLGGFNRYIPMGFYTSPYTFFIDDDVLPGTKCIESFLEAAEKLPNFGVLGQVGRVLSSDDLYRPKDVSSSADFREVDFIVRAYFVKTRYLFNVLKYKWLLGYHETKLIEDDLLLCCALKHYENLPCYLIPFDGDRERLINKEELSNLHSLSSRRDHYALRSFFIKRVMIYGWNPIHRRRTLDET
ncbi:glycosyltransferase [Sphingobacterium multivorum]|uniref:glycosyltransferase n=1 Tax=Sphingobacterium multivorum TaxID=28454 RepID=UPI002898162F|nr:glycosyltransferase [Sphingobacterium multivorum]